MNQNTIKIASAVFLIFLSAVFACGQPDRGAGVRPAGTAAPTEKRLALVIGNGAYKNADALANPVNDASDMAQTLKDLGFEVISGTNQSKAQMQTLIRQFGARLAETKAVGLFFYAGHGIAAGGTNFLIPVDADIQAEDEIEEGGVSINFVLNKMAAANNGFNMVVLDACRNNPFARKWRNYRDIGGGGGLTKIDAPTGTLIAYATKPGETASDGAGRNGLYTGALLRQMRVKNIEMGKMFQLVRAEVIKQSSGRQVPFDESSVVGDFYFAGIEASAAIQNRIDVETEYWENIKTSQSSADFKDYLNEFPSGRFAALARQRINQFDRASKPATETDKPNVNSAGNSSSAAAEYEKQKNEVVERNKKTAQTNLIVNQALNDGNAAFSAKNYDLAILKYDEGYNADPQYVGSAPTFLNNKAAALRVRGFGFYSQSIKDQANKAALLQKAKIDFFASVDALRKSIEITGSANVTDLNLQRTVQNAKIYAFDNLSEIYRLIIMTRTDLSPELIAETVAAYQAYFKVETDPAEIKKRRVYLGDLLRYVGDGDGAIAAYRTALAAAPDSLDALGGLGLSLFDSAIKNRDRRQMQESINLMQKFVNLAPDTHPLKANAKDAIAYLKTEEKMTPQTIL